MNTFTLHCQHFVWISWPYFDYDHCVKSSVTNCCLFIPKVACMQFINIVVHSVEDMNFRVHLQYDFTKLNLDEHLEVTWSHDQPKSVLYQHYNHYQVMCSW